MLHAKVSVNNVPCPVWNINDFFKHGTPDGFFAKTNKASMLHFLLEDITGGPLP